MTIKDLYEKGKFPYTNMTVTRRLAELAEEFDAHMKCDINAISFENDNMYSLYLDFSPYEKFNKTVAVPSFWDEKGNPTLTWFESGYYKDGKVEIYVMETDTFEELFEKKTVEDLRNEFNPSRAKHSMSIMNTEGYTFYLSEYVEWLENRILNLV